MVSVPPLRDLGAKFLCHQSSIVNSQSAIALSRIPCPGFSVPFPDIVPLPAFLWYGSTREMPKDQRQLSVMLRCYPPIDPEQGRL